MWVTYRRLIYYTTKTKVIIKEAQEKKRRNSKDIANVFPKTAVGQSERSTHGRAVNLSHAVAFGTVRLVNAA